MNTSIHLPVPKHLLTLSLLILAAVLLCTTSAEAQFWQYQMPITIDNSTNPEPLSDHQVLITVDTATLIGAGKMQADGADIRFYDSATGPLCHTVESGINTAATMIWVKVPAVPGNSTSSILLLYGNPGASTADDPTCTFSFFEGFDDGVIPFSDACGSTTWNVAGGTLDLSWASSGMLIADPTFPVGEVHMVEANVVAATGTWPAIYWSRDTNLKSYGLMINTTQARISVTGGGTDYCSGHNWASGLFTYSSVAGIWEHTWVATGDQRSNFPTIGPITSTDTTHARDEDLRLLIGGISSGTGSIQIDWIRTRKWTEIQPTFSTGVEAIAMDVQPLSLVVAEPAGVDTFDVSLGFVPSADVVIGLQSSDPTACTPLPTSITLNAGNLSDTVTVMAVTDNTPAGNRPCAVVTQPIASGDAFLNGQNLPDVGVTVTDDGVPVELMHFSID